MRQIATPTAILNDWLGNAPDDVSELETFHGRWFGKSFETDRHLAETYLDTLAALAHGLAYEWSARDMQSRLAAIIALDQFSRNIFRDHSFAFRHDRLALGLAKEAILSGADKHLREVERMFLYLPLEHSEHLPDQVLSVQLYTKLVAEARPAYRDFLTATLDFAQRHHDVIAQFGRFPHRNKALKRTSTREEIAYLAEPGAGF
ncbi:MAG: DUF924 family protein [Pseudomonadota bacterium]